MKIFGVIFLSFALMHNVDGTISEVIGEIIEQIAGETGAHGETGAQVDGSTGDSVKLKKKWHIQKQWP